MNGPHVGYSNFRISVAYTLATPGKGAVALDMTFTASAALVGAMVVGIMRQALENALAWAQSEKRWGRDIVLQKWSVADLLIRMKTRLEAGRALTWKATQAFETSLVLGCAMTPRFFVRECCRDCD